MNIPNLKINLPGYERIAESLRLSDGKAMELLPLVVAVIRGRQRGYKATSGDPLDAERAPIVGPKIVERLRERGLKSETQLRDIVRHLCLFGTEEYPKGVPIGSNDEGYWWIVTDQDREVAKSHFMSRARVNLMRAVAIDFMFDAIPVDRIGRERYVEEHQLNLF